jgi:hypothetical protein
MQDKNDIRNNRIAHIYRLLDATTKSMEKIKVMLKNLDKDDQRKSYQEVEGIMGTFDGVHLVTADGQKHEVPANYSAKSRLVIGDTLKMIEEEGKHIFKQVEKVDRKKVEGILTKKEGKWHIISDSGTYKVADIAADFQHAELNDEASAFIPAKNLNVAFAALDAVKKKVAKTSAPAVVADIPAKPSATAVQAKPAPAVRPAPSVNPVQTARPAPAPKTEKPIVKPHPVAAAERPAPRPVSAPATHTSHAAQAPAARPQTSSDRPASRPARPAGGKPRSGTGSASGAKPYRPAPRKEYVEDIVNPATPTTATQVNLDEDDLR